MTLRLITESTIYPVTLAEAKQYCRVQTTVDDSLITSMIRAATKQAEIKTKRSLMSQSWAVTLKHGFPLNDGPIELLRPPLSTVSSNVSVSYINTTGGSTTLPEANYFVDYVSEPGMITLSTGVTQWPETSTRVNSVTVNYVSGYILDASSEATTPEDLKLWINSRVLQMYDERNPVSTSVRTTLKRDFVDGLLDEYRIKEVQ
jgi:uncharacterized phiE125 gp8 family phage protein